jgi:hypothetical protein
LVARLSRPVFAIALGLVLCALAGAGTASSATPSAQARYLVVFNSNVLPSDAAQRVTKNGGTVVRSFAPIGVVAAIGDASFASKMSSDTKVQSVGTEHAFRLPETTTRFRKQKRHADSRLRRE